MMIRKTPCYSFDDVLLVPQHSQVESRLDVDTSTKLGSMSLKFPFLSANMDTVTGPRMAIAMGQYGGLGVLHRSATDGDILNWVGELQRAEVPAVISVGVNRNGDSIELIRRIQDLSHLSAVCIDIAHGHSVKAITTVQRIRSSFPDLDIIAGNVATGAGAFSLASAGANIIKVGIGPGSVCTTRVVTGHGVPQLTAIMDVCNSLNMQNMQNDVQVIADGGIRYPGDIVKALAAGADAVMFGSLLAGTEESPGYVFVEHQNTYKTFRGSASFHAQRNNEVAPQVEGISAQVPFRGTVKWTLNNMRDGLRSGLSYSGAFNLRELQQKAEFVVVTGNSVRESHPHHPYVL